MSDLIRLAREHDLDLLPDIERSAAEAFRGSIKDDIAHGEVSPAWFYRPLAAAGLVWVAETDGALAGFAASESFPDAVHLWELAVRHDAQGRGLGRALIAAVADGARQRGLPAVTLTTFRDIPWNAPFYARLGFRILGEAELPERLAATLAKEATRGLTDRCAMRLSLT